MASDRIWEDYDPYRYMTPKEVEESKQTRDDACPECFLVHKGECL